MKVYCYPVSATSTYIPLLFDGIEDRYQRVYREAGTLETALADLDAGTPGIVHVHWEEFVLRDCQCDEQADAAADAFITDLTAFRRRGGAIFWTVHNELPHLIAFHRQFLRLRGVLALQAHVVLVHNTASIDVLSAQVPIDRAKIHLLPHPSYLDRHEDRATLRAGLDEAFDRRIQGFGWIRLQKGFGEMVGMLPVSFLGPRNLRIRISGQGIEAGAVVSQQAARGDVHWDIRHVPDVETPRLLRSAACVVLPYERILTSGVALLAITVGAVLVAVDVPQLRELLPPKSQRFLYRRGDADALRRAIDAVLALSNDDRRAMIEANLAVAEQVHPRKVARELAQLYDRFALPTLPAAAPVERSNAD